MIEAEIHDGRARVRLRWADGEVTLSGDASLAQRIFAALQPGRVSWYNPRCGGPYRGFDPADPVQVLDGLQYLEGEGFEVRRVHAELGPAPFIGYGGILDNRDDEAVIEAAGSLSELRYRVDDEDHG